MKHFCHRITCLSLALALSSISIGQQESTPLYGLMVAGASNDRVEQVSAVFRPGESLAELRAKLGEAGFDVRQHNERTAIVIDRQIGLLQRRRTELSVLKALGALKDPFSTRTIAELPEALQQEAVRVLSDLSMMNASESVALGSGAVAFGFSLSISIDSGDGKPELSTSIPPDPAQLRRTFDSLKASPIPGRTYSPEETKKRSEQTTAKNRGSRQFIIESMGRMKSEEGRATKLIGAELDALLLDIERESDEALRALLKKQSTGTGERIPGHFVDFRSLPEPMKSEISRMVMDSAGAYGFASKADAEAMFLRNPRIQVRTSLVLRFCRKPGDAGANQPASFGGVSIMSFNGIPGP